MKRWVWLIVGVVIVGALVWALVSGTVRISQLVVGSGGDYTITVDSPTGGGVATIHTDGVQSFHLAENADAAGHRITNADHGAVVGDALVYGQPILGGDFLGTYPNPTLVRPMLVGSVELPFGPMSAGTCTEVQQTIPGTPLAGVATAAPLSSLPPGAVIEARVVGMDTVGVRLCALANVVVADQFANIVVVQ